MGAFEAFYASELQHPLALWAAALAGTLAASARRDLHPSLRGYLLGLGVLAILDAWLTSARIYGLGGPLPAALSGAVPLAFVLAGDLRFLLLVEAADEEGVLRADGQALLRALGLTLIVPLLAQGVTGALAWDAARALFLVYELAFIGLCLALLRLHPRLRSVPWLVSLTRFVLLYYGLWAAADVWILATGSDLGFGLRALPNLLYYGGFIAVVARLAPARAPAASADRARAGPRAY